MANTKSALKQWRASERRRRYNKPIRTGVRNRVKDARALIQAHDLEAAQTAVLTAQSALDKAATKGVIHRNNAARRKSRLMKQLAALAKSGVSA